MYTFFYDEDVSPLCFIMYVKLRYSAFFITFFLRAVLFDHLLRDHTFHMGQPDNLGLYYLSFFTASVRMCLLCNDRVNTTLWSTYGPSGENTLLF